MFNLVEMYLSLSRYCMNKAVNALEERAEAFRERSVKHMQASLQMADQSKRDATEAADADKRAAKLRKQL